MKAVFVREFGDAENLEFREVAEPPQPTGKEVLVKIRASALNRADILQRKGLYPPPPEYPDKILGLEFAGEIAAVGEKVSAFTPGDRVFGITGGGAQAELLLTEEFLLAAVPANLSFIEAAAVPEAFITAHDALFAQAGLREGERLLIHAVGSGVGLAALQLAKARGVVVYGTSRTAEKLEKCREFGLDAGIEVSGETDFAGTVRQMTGDRGVDVILDLVGAKYFDANLKSLGQKGRLMLVGLTGGSRAEFNLGLALSRRLTVRGTVLRSRTSEEKAAATAAFIGEVVPLLAGGKLRPNIDKIYRVEEIRRAHEYLESNASFGKVVLEF